GTVGSGFRRRTSFDHRGASARLAGALAKAVSRISTAAWSRLRGAALRLADDLARGGAREVPDVQVVFGVERALRARTPRFDLDGPQLGVARRLDRQPLDEPLRVRREWTEAGGDPPAVPGFERIEVVLEEFVDRRIGTRIQVLADHRGDVREELRRVAVR